MSILTDYFAVPISTFLSHLPKKKKKKYFMYLLKMFNVLKGLRVATTSSNFPMGKGMSIFKLNTPLDIAGGHINDCSFEWIHNASFAYLPFDTRVCIIAKFYAL